MMSTTARVRGDSSKSNIVLFLAYISSVVLWGYSLISPSVNGIQFLFPYNGRFLLFPYPTLTILCLVLSIFVPIATFVYLFKRYKTGQISRYRTPFLLIFAPLLFLPLSSALLAFRSQIDQHGLVYQQIFANILFYVPVLIFAYILFKIIEHLSWQAAPAKRISKTLIVLVGFFFFLFYWLIGWYVTLSCGEHASDEGHYIIQAKSLYYDHDLELSNNLDEKALEYVKKGRKDYIHMAPSAKDGKLYSWHAFGLPLYLAIFPADNFQYRHFLLGLLSGLGSAGLLFLCRFLNVPQYTGLLFVFLFCFSPFWGIYSSRVLPEAPGAVLTIWTAVALFVVRRHSWIAGLILIICCGYLPFLHPRFAVISFFGYLFFLFYFVQTKQFIKKMPVILFTTSGLVFLAITFLYVNSKLYSTGSSYPSTSTFLFTYVPGIWEILTELILNK